MKALLVFALLIGSAQAAQRPAEMLADAHAAFIQGDLDAAETGAHAIIDRWPSAARARLLLARIRRAQGRSTDADTLLKWVASNAAEPLAAVARRQLSGQARATGWQIGGRTAVAWDSAVLPPGARDPTSTADGRTELAVDAEATGRRWGLGFGVARTLHFEAGHTDATLGQLGARWRFGGQTHRWQVAADGRAVLVGRTPEAHHIATGAGIRWWRARPWSPFAVAQAHWAHYQAAAERVDAPDEARLHGATGVRWLGGRTRVFLRLDGRWFGPDEVTGFREVIAATGADIRLGRWTLGGRIGYGPRWTDIGREHRPQARLGVRWDPLRWLALTAEGRWQAAFIADDRVDRLIATLGVEARR